MTEAGEILSLSLSVEFERDKPILDDLSLKVQRGEILALLGASGSGKSTLALAILRLLDRKRANTSGCVEFNGRDLLLLPEREMRQVRGREIGLVLQSPTSALNPALRLATHLCEAWRAHEKYKDGKGAIAQALERVSLPNDTAFLKRYPREISVGQGQRILIAIALLHSPTLLIADEPTSALDAITQMEILELFEQINKERHTSILLISHDLSAMRAICDRVAILHQGKIIECDTWENMITLSTHPYVHSLMRLERGQQRSTGASVGRD